MQKRIAGAMAWAAGALVLAACEQPQPAAPSEAPAGTDYALPPFVGRIWMSTTRGHAPGAIRVFLPDKTVLLGSCTEGYRIADWGVISADTIRWRESAIPIEAQYSQPSKDALRLKIVGIDREETYVAASAPYVCQGP